MWILVGTVLVIVGGFLNAYFSYKQSLDSQIQTDRVDSNVQSVGSDVKSLNQKISQQEKQIEELKEDLLLAQKKTIEEMEKANLAQKQMIDYTTGGDSFPYLHVTDWVGNVGTVSIINTNPKNRSINPLQNLVINIIDVSIFIDLLHVQKKTPREVRDKSTVLRTTLNWLSPHTASEIGQIDLGEFYGGERKFNATIEANGKFYSEQIVIRKKHGELFFGISLADVNNVPLRVTYQPGFLDSDEKMYNFSKSTFGKFTLDEKGNLLAN